MRIIFITGASGSGKTTLLKGLQKRYAANFDFYYFDSIGVPSTEEMNAKFGSGDEWQRQTTLVWTDRILGSSDKDVAILDGQMRLAFITEASRTRNFKDYRIILVDCDDSTRTQRLQDRKQPGLANEDMMNWAKYLRDETRQLGAQVLDTSGKNIAESESDLLALIKSS